MTQGESCRNNDDAADEGSLPQWVYMVALHEELEIEATLSEIPQPMNDITWLFSIELKRALREIDRLKISGSYVEEKRRLEGTIDKSGEIGMLATMLRVAEIILSTKLKNLLRGMSSPDGEQRNRFRRFSIASGLSTGLPWGEWERLLDLLSTQEKAKKPHGRPGIAPPWRNVVRAMDDMRMLCATGLEGPAAAREVADRVNNAGAENRAKRFLKLYRQRLELRE